MKKLIYALLCLAIICSLSIPFALPAAAKQYDLTGTWLFNDIWQGVAYPHTITISTFNPDGTFSGTGYYNNYPITEDVTGQLIGDSITFHWFTTSEASYGVTIDGTGTLLSSSYMSGTGFQSDGYGPISWDATRIQSQPPVADFKIYPADDPTPGQYKPGQTIPMVGGLITFDATDSTGDIVMYRWDFGDKGNYIVETYEPIVNHIYKEEKTYHVTLEVVDSNGNTATKTMDFTIPKLQPGDILFCCTRGYEFIPGFFTHCGIYLGNGKIVETVYGAGHGLPANGVGISDIMEWSADHETAVAVYRPIINAQYVKNAVHIAKNFARQNPHITYDLIVAFKSQAPDSYYCSELVWAAYSLGSGGNVVFTPWIKGGSEGYWTDVSIGEINLGNTWGYLGMRPDRIAADPRLQYVAGHWEDEPGSPN